MFRLATRARPATLGSLGARGLRLSPSPAAAALRWRPQPVLSLPASSPASPRSSYYTPPQYPAGYPAYPQPAPKKWRHRFRDMVIGGGLTLLVYLAYQYAEVRKLRKKIKEVLAARERDDELHEALMQAREAGDNEALRELTFEITRNITQLNDDTHYWADVGPLPSFPLGDDRCGQDLVPESETLVMLQRKKVEAGEEADEAGSLLPWAGSGGSSSSAKTKDEPEKWRVHTVFVTVNMDLNDEELHTVDDIWVESTGDEWDDTRAMERRMVRAAREALSGSAEEAEQRVLTLLRDAYGIDRAYNPRDARLRELFDRIEYQIRQLAQRGEIDSQGRLWVGLSLQDRSRVFDYNYRDGFRLADLQGPDF